MATRKFSELRAAIAADPIRAERLRLATEVVGRPMTKTFLINMVDYPIGSIEAAEIRKVLQEVGYRGVQVLDAKEPRHEHPCPSGHCVQSLRDAGHDITEATICCVCWGQEQSRI
jgi:hypothetical protein